MVGRASPKPYFVMNWPLLTYDRLHEAYEFLLRLEGPWRFPGACVSTQPRPKRSRFAQSFSPPADLARRKPVLERAEHSLVSVLIALRHFPFSFIGDDLPNMLLVSGVPLIAGFVSLCPRH